MKNESFADQNIKDDDDLDSQIIHQQNLLEEYKREMRNSRQPDNSLPFLEPVLFQSIRKKRIGRLVVFALLGVLLLFQIVNYLYYFFFGDWIL